jgi:uracil-DNA glycosylase family 4
MTLLQVEPAITRASRFDALVATAQACRACPRMDGRQRAISPANGPLDAPILFVAEAPGRLGADLTGVPLSGDRTGQNFDALLAAAGIDRRQVFVTNAVLCNPRDDGGRNARPRGSEIRNCGSHLHALMKVLDPAWVVSLGRVALDSLALIEPHGCLLARDVATARPWYCRTLVPLYHPGPRSVAVRGMIRHVEEFQRLASLLVTADVIKPILRDGTLPPGESARRSAWS